MKIHDFTYRGKEYQCHVPDIEERRGWVAYRKVNGYYQKIPCFTRAEENRFPVGVAKICSKLFEASRRMSQ